jgi:hypothetical protein
VIPVGWDTRWARGFHDQAFVGWTRLGEAVDDAAEFLAAHVATLGAPGVYAVFAPLEWTPQFKTRGRFENVIEPWSQERLRRRWIDGVELVYIGCAGATPNSRPLCERVRDLLRHGGGHLTAKGPHKGGERLWQCRGWENFTLAWKRCGDYPEPHDLEVAIGRRFQALAGGLPFANVRL